MDPIDKFRTVLLITLSLLLVAVAYRRFRRKVQLAEMPVIQHAELDGLQVAYHPARLRAEIMVPETQSIFPSILDHAHRNLHTWSVIQLPAGRHAVELDLPPNTIGEFFFELSTGTQRTVRKFTVRA